MNIKILIKERGTTGFTIEDTTGIIGTESLTTGFLSDIEEIHQSIYRTSDVVFLDFVTYNQLSKPITEYFVSPIGSDTSYRDYKLSYSSLSPLEDPYFMPHNPIHNGWYTISHLVIPTTDWFTATYTDARKDGTYYAYNTTELAFYLISKNGANLLEKVLSDQEVITVLYKAILTNNTILGVEDDLFLVGLLEKCFLDKVKAILFNKLYTCYPKDSPVVRDRDMVWMTLELVKHLVEKCLYYEALRILESVDSCNGFCKEILYQSHSKCNCG